MPSYETPARRVMFPAIFVIGALEGVDVIREQLFKADIKSVIRPLFDDDKKLINGKEKIEIDGFSIAITPLPSRSTSDRQYNIEVYDSSGGVYPRSRHPRRRLKYDARRDSLRYWKLRHEAGWGLW
jgi:hypothetical protein